MAFTRSRSLDFYKSKNEKESGSDKKNEKESGSHGSDKKNETKSGSHGSSDKKNETESGSSSSEKKNEKEIISYAGLFQASGPMNMRAVRHLQNARQRAASV